MSVRFLGAVLTVLLVVAGCSSQDSSRTVPARPTAAAVPGAPALFVNRVWVVAESEQVAPGDLRVFLSEGTLVMAGPQARPPWELVAITTGT